MIPPDGPSPSAAETASPVLETRGLGRRFGGLEAVADVSFSLPAGQVLGIIGPNGAGKSTLVNLVTGALRPSGGHVLIDGRDLTGARPWELARAGVARTFQLVKPFRGMTVLENVAVGALHPAGDRQSWKTARAQADDALERVGLGKRAHDRPGELSVADARRLELAKALALRPRLLLLDEVMAGLRGTEIDPALELIHELKAEGMTIIVVEHLMKAIVSISDTVLVLHHGRVLTMGHPHDVLSDERVIEAYLGRRYAQRQGH